MAELPPGLLDVQASSGNGSGSHENKAESKARDASPTRQPVNANQKTWVLEEGVRYCAVWSTRLKTYISEPAEMPLPDDHHADEEKSKKSKKKHRKERKKKKTKKATTARLSFPLRPFYPRMLNSGAAVTGDELLVRDVKSGETVAQLELGEYSIVTSPNWKRDKQHDAPAHTVKSLIPQLRRQKAKMVSADRAWTCLFKIGTHPAKPDVSIIFLDSVTVKLRPDGEKKKKEKKKKSPPRKLAKEVAELMEFNAEAGIKPIVEGKRKRVSLMTADYYKMLVAANSDNDDDEESDDSEIQAAV